MKKILIPVLAGIGLCFVQFSASAQTYKTHVSKSFDMQNGVVGIFNLDGSIKVEGYAGSKVMIEIDETITGENQAALDEGKRDFKLGFDQKGDSLAVYTAYPYDTRPHSYYRHYGDDNNRDIHYNIKLVYTVKVPNNVTLFATTVNDGDIAIKNVYGSLKINNVNGGIEILNAKGTTWAHTVNGPLTATYLRNPPGESSYYTLNGELNATFLPDLSADVSFKSMNGQFFTDFDNTQVMPSKVTKTTSRGSSGTTYKLNQTPDVRFGAGGKSYKFETLNGNIYIKKQKA